MADKTQGLITLLRDISKHWLWKYKPFSRGQAWIDMLLLANHTTEKVPFENRIEIVERGQFITSQTKLAMRWGWTRQQVRTFLTLLEDPNPDAPMVICQNLTNRATKLTIINYSDLQKLPTKLITRPQPTDNQPTTINKNDKNEKNDKKDIYIPIEYLNQKTKSHFDPKNKSNQDLVRARYNEGRTLDDFKQVIDTKATQWLNDEKMMKYLRPSTLFNRTNFENYLNEPKPDPMAKFLKKEQP